MKYSRRFKIILVCLFLNILVLIILSFIKPGEYILRQLEEENLHADNASLTVLIHEFEEFENDVAATLESVTRHFPLVTILIVCKRPPYPPLEVTRLQNIKVIIQEQQANNPHEWGDPMFYIKTKYLLIIPDATRLINAPKLQHIIWKSFKREDSLDGIVAFPIDKQSKCVQLKTELRQWTLSYENIAEENGVCDALSGSSKVALLFPTSYLRNLSEPFLRPFPQALFIQFSIRRWKSTVVDTEDIFSVGKNLFSNSHLRWKAERKQKERLLHLYKRFGVKLVRQDGIDNWYGCSKESSRCFGTVVDDMPDYIYEGKFTPPCCMRHLKETTRYVLNIFFESGLSHWLEGGSLLGAARNGDIIPWDYDVDIGIYQHEIAKCEQLKMVEESRNKKYVDNQRFVWEKANEGEFYRVQFSESNHLHVDIFPFYEKDGVMTKNTWFKTHRQDAEFPSHYLKPLKTLQFAGMKASVPNNHREFLELKFGKGVIENPQFPNPSKMKLIEKE